MNYHKTFEVGMKENERFNLFSIRRKTFQMCSMVFLMISFIVTLTQLTRGNRFICSLLIGSGYGIAGILFFIIANLLLIKYRLHLFYKKGKIKPFVQQIEMNEKGIHAITENGFAQVVFDQINGVRETKHAFYIFVTAEHVYVFPKNQMIGKEEFCEIRNIFRAGISADQLQLQR